MSNILKYKNYIAVLNFSIEDDTIVGKVINSDAIIAFHGNNLAELKQAFEDMVDSYLEACKVAGNKPELPYSGTFNLRLGSDLHREACIKAAANNISLNTLVVSLVEKGLHSDQAF